MTTAARLNRRTFSAALASTLFLPRRVIRASEATPIAVARVPSVVIDLTSEPPTIDPARAYSDVEWSIVHSIYDAIIGFDDTGQLQPVAAESFAAIDDVTFEVVLRPGMTFHDGSPVTAGAVRNGMDILHGENSLVSDLFGVVSDVEIVDDHTARIVCSAPSPWLPAQMAAWLVLLPDGSTDDARASSPVGSGPYRFAQWDRGNEIRLERFDAYAPAAIKGVPIADDVRYHFVPDATTRASNIASGGTDIAATMPVDTVALLDEADVEARRYDISGSAWIRIGSDAEPFTDVRVRRAANLAIDVDAFAGSLVHDGSRRLASLLPDESAMGFDPALAPYAYDPEQARALLTEAGLADGADIQLEITSDTPQPVAQAIASQLAEIGLRTEIVLSDYAAFNANWSDPTAPALKQVTWSPLFDPSTLLGLVFAGDGVLSRYDNADASALIADAAAESDPDARTGLYRELAALMHDDAPAIWLWNLVDVVGVSADASAWTERKDRWILPLHRER